MFAVKTKLDESVRCENDQTYGRIILEEKKKKKKRLAWKKHRSVCGRRPLSASFRSFRHIIIIKIKKREKEFPPASRPLDDVLVEVGLAVVGGCEGVEPGD